MSISKELKFDIEKCVRVLKVFTKENSKLTKNGLILTMIDANNSAAKKEVWVSPITAIVSKLYAHENDILSFGSIILEYEQCTHSTLINFMCGDCGIDLKHQMETETFNHNLAASVSMIPTRPEVRITQQNAERYGIEDRNSLLKSRKLDLLIDLDQTLIHTTNAEHYPYSKDVIHYSLHNAIFYTKLRPGVKEFLTNLLPFYQFHIVTFGERLYAHKIVSFIDPDKKFFYDRILSRDECLDQTKKTANLSSLFPCGDSLVCIIDDREDVWNYAKNLVHVKPYLWFENVGDINDISLPSLPLPSNQLIPPINEQESLKQLENSQQIQNEQKKIENNMILEHLNILQSSNNINQNLSRAEKRPFNTGIVDNNHENGIIDALNRKKLGDNDKLVEVNEQIIHHKLLMNDLPFSDVSTTSKLTSLGEKQSQQENIPYNYSNIIKRDEDIYLNRLEIILKHIHEVFYNTYDIWLQTEQHNSMPDLKQIVPDIRRQILSDVSMCFSGIMHVDQSLEKYRAYIIAKALGANVTKDLVLKDNGGHMKTNIRTTHLVAGKETQKVHRARKHNIYVITLEWLIDCYEQWEHKNEMNYIFNNNYDISKFRLFTDEKSRGIKRLRSDGGKHHHRYDEQQNKTTETKNRVADTINGDQNTRNIAETLQESQIFQGEDSGTKSSTNNDELVSTSTFVSPIAQNNEEYGDNNRKRWRQDDSDKLMFSTNELEEMEKEMDDFCSDTNDSEDDKKESRMNDFSEYEPTFEEENENDLDEEQEKRLRNLVLGTNKKGEYDSSDEDSLGGDDIPKGWKQKKKKCPF